MSKKFQKVVSLTTSVTTIVWLSGIAALAPMSAMAATILEGDTIKTADNPDVYIAKYVGAKKFKRLILNPQVFNSYGHLSWSKIKTVTQAEMDVFTTSDLVRALGDTKVYKLIPNGDEGTKQWVNMTAEAFTAAGYDWDSVYVINNTDRDNYTPGSDITGGTSASPSTSASTSVAAGALSVALSSDTPAAASILSDGSTATSLDGQALIPAVKYTFTAGSGGDIKVTTLKLTRTGVSADADIDNVYLYDGDNILSRLADMQSIASKIITFTSSDGLFTVPANGSKTILVRFDLNREADSGKTLGLVLNAAADITSNASSVSGSFPLSSNLMSTATATDFGGVKVEDVADNAAAVDPGTTDFIGGHFKITPSNQNLQLKYLRLLMVGSAATTDVTNLKLYDSGTQIGSTQQLSSDKYVTFDLTASPLEINSAVVKNLYIRVDVPSGSSRTFKFSIMKGADIIVYDTGYNIYLRPNSGTVGSFTTQSSVQATIGSGTMSVNKTTDSPSSNIADGGAGLTFAKFSMKAVGEDVKVSELSYYCTSSDTASKIKNVKLMIDGTQTGTTDATITCEGAASDATTTVNFTIPAGVTKYLTIVGDTTDSTVDVEDTYAFTLAGGPSSDNAQAMSSMDMVDVPSANTSANTLTVKSGTITVAKNTGFGNATASNPTGVIGRTNVKIGSFTIKAGSGEDVKITQIILNDDGTYDLGGDFQNLKIMYGSTQIGSTIANLQTTTAYDYTFSPSTDLIITNGQTAVFDVYADILTSAADTAKTDLEIEVASVSATGISTSADAGDSLSTDVSLQNIYISSSGTLLIENVPTSSQVQAQTYHSSNTATNEVELYKFKLTAYTEAIDVTRIIVTDTIKSQAYGATTTNGRPTTTFSSFKLYKGTTVVGNATLYATSTPANGGYLDFNIGSATPITLTAGEEAIFTLKGTVNDWTQISSGSTHKFSLRANDPIQDLALTDAVTAKGHDSSASKNGPTSTINSNEITIRKSYPVVERLALPTTTLASGTSDGVSIAKFKVSAVGGEIRLKKMTFNVTLTDTTTSTALSLSAFKLYRNGSLAGTTEYDLFDGSGSGTADQLSSTGLATLSTDALKGDLGAANTTNTYVVLSFAPVTEVDGADNADGEEIISAGDTNTYEIKCTVTNAHTGATTDTDSIVVQLLGDDSQTQPYTGNLSNVTASTDNFGIIGVGGTNYYFVWSDYSANTGDHMDDVPSSSADWTHGYQVRKDTSSVSFIPLDSWSLTK